MGNIIGIVMEGFGIVLFGVVVILSGDCGIQILVIGVDGLYCFGFVFLGNYLFKVEFEGFLFVGVMVFVSVGGWYQIDLMFQFGMFEEIIVIFEVLMVDKFNVMVGVMMEVEIVGEIFVLVCFFYGVLQVLFGVINDVELVDFFFFCLMVNGVFWQEFNVYVDGVDMMYLMCGGGICVFLLILVLSEVFMEVGGGLVEYGCNVGLYINFIVKLGINKFYGDLVGVYFKNFWNENYDLQFVFVQDLCFVCMFIDQGQIWEQVIEMVINWFVYVFGECVGDNVNIEVLIGGLFKCDKVWWFVVCGEILINQFDNMFDGELFNNSLDLFVMIVKLNFQFVVSYLFVVIWIDVLVDCIFLLLVMGDCYNVIFFDFFGDVLVFFWNWLLNDNFFFEMKFVCQVFIENCCCFFGLDVKVQDLCYFLDVSFGVFVLNNNDNVFVQNFDNSWYNGWIFVQGFGMNEFLCDQLNLVMIQFVGVNYEIKFGVDVQCVQWDQVVQCLNIQMIYDFVLGMVFGLGNDCNVWFLI